MLKPFRKDTQSRPSNPLRGDVESSDFYVDKNDLRDEMSIEEDTGYESDCVKPTKGPRCNFSLRSRLLGLKKQAKSTKTPPPSPTPSVSDSELIPSSLGLENVGVRYSLRSSIGDGARQPIGPTFMERRELRPNGSHLNTSHWSEEGARKYMEDRYSIEELGFYYSSQKNLSSYSSRSSIPMTYFGVFDGHGGERSSQFCCDYLSSYIRHQAEFPVNLGLSMKQAFQSADNDFCRSGFTDGSAAISCIVIGKEKIICANAGDCRAIVVRSDGSVAKLSRDHKPGVHDETKRITELGGKIVYWGRWRVEGILAVSRGIGDSALKPFITAEPEICEYTIGKFHPDFYKNFASIDYYTNSTHNNGKIFF